MEQLLFRVVGGPNYIGCIGLNWGHWALVTLENYVRGGGGKKRRRVEIKGKNSRREMYAKAVSTKGISGWV